MDFSLYKAREITFMKNEFGNAVSEVKQPQLAIVKRIDELPTWKRPEKPASRVEHPFEPKKIEPVKSKKKPQNKRNRNTFKNWNLPIQPEGYLKPKMNDLL